MAQAAPAVGLADILLTPQGLQALQTDIGRSYLKDYFSAVQTWASIVPEGDSLTGFSPAEIAKFYPDGADIE